MSTQRLLFLSCGCLQAEQRSLNSELVYMGYRGLELLQLEASRQVGRRCLGFLVCFGYYEQCQGKLCHTWAVVTFLGQVSVSGFTI